MAARLNNRHQSLVREKIKASQLINRLDKHAHGKLDLKATQVDAAKYLISQSIGSPPSSTVISGDPEAPVVVKGVVELVRPS